MQKQKDGLDEQLPQPSTIQRKIAELRADHPDSVVVYFTKHRSAPDSLPKPNNPL
jgi:hypothetical protein